MQANDHSKTVLTNSLTEEEKEKAYRLWWCQCAVRDTDKDVFPFLTEGMLPFECGQKGWLRKARQALLLSMDTVAKKAEVSSATYASYEERERLGTLTLATLARVAAAMDCELIYAVRPKNGKIFSRIIWEKLLVVSASHPWLNKCDQRKRKEALVGIVKRYLADPKFRRRQGWAKNARNRT